MEHSGSAPYVLGWTCCPQGAVPLSVLTEVPSARGPVKFVDSFVNGRLAEREWPRRWDVGLLSLQLVLCMAQRTYLWPLELLLDPKLSSLLTQLSPGIFTGRAVRVPGPSGV